MVRPARSAQRRAPEGVGHDDLDPPRLDRAPAERRPRAADAGPRRAAPRRDAAAADGADLAPAGTGRDGRASSPCSPAPPCSTSGSLSASGYGNSFYAAAVQAGSQSWKAFFFGSLDAGNAITVDKPPASLWLMALSVRIFGLSSWSVLAPQALLGVATVGVTYASVRRTFERSGALARSADRRRRTAPGSSPARCWP